jgi:hypothetical protein
VFSRSPEGITSQETSYLSEEIVIPSFSTQSPKFLVGIRLVDEEGKTFKRSKSSIDIVLE